MRLPRSFRPGSGQNKTALAALRVQERRKPNFRGTTLIAANGGRSCAPVPGGSRPALLRDACPRSAGCSQVRPEERSLPPRTVRRLSERLLSTGISCSSHYPMLFIRRGGGKVNRFFTVLAPFSRKGWKTRRSGPLRRAFLTGRIIPRRQCPAPGPAGSEAPVWPWRR